MLNDHPDTPPTGKNGRAPRPKPPTPDSIDEGAGKPNGGRRDRHLDPLPPIVSAKAFLAEPLPLPPILIEGLMGEQEKHLTSGGSKSFKTWLQLDEAISVAAGVPFLGMETKRKRVLFCNFEIPAAHFQERMKAVCKAKGVKESQVWENLDVWNLRGRSQTIDQLIPLMLEGMRGRKPYGLLTLDPVYKLMGDRSENDATAVGNFFEHLDGFIDDTGAAISMSHHHSKGNQSSKSALDRSSGSGVWSRDPDAIRDLTPHSEDGSFTFSTTLRLRAGLDRFVVTWDFPLFRRNERLDPEDLKSPGNTASTTTAQDIVEVLRMAGKPLTATEWQKLCARDGVCGSSRFYELKKMAGGMIRETPRSHGRNAYFEAL